MKSLLSSLITTYQEMISPQSLIVCSVAVLTLTIAVQSIPLRKSMQKVNPSIPVKAGALSLVQTPEEEEEEEENLDDYDQSNDDDEDDALVFNDRNKHVLHAQVKETPAQNHSIADESLDTEDAQLFTDVKMFPNELRELGSQRRRRRQLTTNDKLPERRKRALSSLNDPFYRAYMPDDQYLRSTRDLGPVFWYPLLFQRFSRSAIDEDENDPWISEEFAEPIERYSTPLERWSTFDDGDDFPINYYPSDDDGEENSFYSI